MSVRRIDQGMAAAAAGLLPPRVSRELRTRYRQLRIMTHTAGLAATYAFIAAKAGERNDLADAYRRAGEGITERLIGLGLLSGEAKRMTARDVLDQLGTMDAVEYARASTETAAFTGWLARLADAMYQADSPASDRRDGEASSAGGRDAEPDGHQAPEQSAW